MLFAITLHHNANPPPLTLDLLSFATACEEEAAAAGLRARLEGMGSPGYKRLMAKLIS